MQVRTAGCVWLTSLVSFTGRQALLLQRLAEVQEAFSSLLGDSVELTQELASRGLSKVYHLGDAAAQQALLQSLMGTLQGECSPFIMLACPGMHSPFCAWTDVRASKRHRLGTASAGTASNAMPTCALGSVWMSPLHACGGLLHVRNVCRRHQQQHAANSVQRHTFSCLPNDCDALHMFVSCSNLQGSSPRKAQCRRHRPCDACVGVYKARSPHPGGEFRSEKHMHDRADFAQGAPGSGGRSRWRGRRACLRRGSWGRPPGGVA